MNTTISYKTLVKQDSLTRICYINDRTYKEVWKAEESIASPTEFKLVTPSIVSQLETAEEEISPEILRALRSSKSPEYQLSKCLCGEHSVSPIINSQVIPKENFLVRFDFIGKSCLKEYPRGIAILKVEQDYREWCEDTLRQIKKAHINGWCIYGAQQGNEISLDEADNVLYRSQSSPWEPCKEEVTSHE